MQIEKEQVADFLRSQGEHDKASQASCALPQHVDTDQDAGLLHKYDINVSDLAEEDQAEAPDA